MNMKKNSKLLKIVQNINFAKKINNIKIKIYVIYICNDYLKSIFLNIEKKN